MKRIQGSRCPRRPDTIPKRKSDSSELEAKGTEFYGGTAPLITTKEPPSSTDQPGRGESSLVWRIYRSAAAAPAM